MFQSTSISRFSKENINNLHKFKYNESVQITDPRGGDEDRRWVQQFSKKLRKLLKFHNRTNFWIKRQSLRGISILHFRNHNMQALNEIGNLLIAIPNEWNK